MYKIISLFLFFSVGIYSETIIRPFYAQRGGIYVFEIGNRFPNLSGFRAGSRISFDRDYRYGGIELLHTKGPWEFRGSFATTGWYVNTGTARDEDFSLFTVSQERATHIASREMAYYDTPYVFSGTRNFADGIGRSSMSEYGFQGFARYHWNQNSSIFSGNSGLFLSAGLSYTYNKYIFYDVQQWVATTPVFYNRIGFGLTFSNSMLMSYWGAGYRFRWENFYFEPSFFYQIGRNQAHDHHVQRFITFKSLVLGEGFLLALEAGWKWNEHWSLFVRHNQNRIFSRGGFIARGGTTPEDLLANFAGNFPAQINIKDWSVELGVGRKLDFETAKLDSTKEAEKKDSLSPSNSPDSSNTNTPNSTDSAPAQKSPAQPEKNSEP